jgi:hypothetical protein
MLHAGSRLPRRWLIAATLLLSLSANGCVGLTAHVLYWIKGGHTIPAEFPGLSGKRVAVVCVANASSFGPNSFSTMVERAVAIILHQNVKKIALVHHDEVAEWIDRNDWDQIDYRQIGRGVSADLVLAIDLDGIRLHEGMTLYKGRADVAVTVYDMSQNGQVVFRKTVPDFTFPRNGARHSTEMSETRFRQLFITVLSQHIAKYFYEYRLEDDFANDAFALNR